MSSKHQLDDHVAPRRVVIVGGGFAGLFAARAFRHSPVEVTVVDKAAHHLFQPLLYQCATGLSEGQIAVPLRGVLSGTTTSIACWPRSRTSTRTPATWSCSARAASRR